MGEFMVKTNTTNPNLRKLIVELEKKGKKNNVPLWVDLAERLSKSRKRRAKVNISKLNRFSEKGETIVAPGKVLGYGNLNKKINVSAFEFSKQARDKIENTGGKCMNIRELMKKNPKGEEVKIIQ